MNLSSVSVAYYKLRKYRRMKYRLLGIMLIGFFCCSVQGQTCYKRTVETPSFITANTSELELKKLILTDEQTQVDAVLYGKPGSVAVISPDTWLVAGQQRFCLREAGGISIGGQTEPERIPENGRVHIVLSFAPVPRRIHEVDLIEEGTGRAIYGIQLSRKEPYVYIPEFLKEKQQGRANELPEPGLSPGKAVVNGYLLGYDVRMPLSMNLLYYDQLFDKEWSKRVRIRQDGSFHLEAEMLQPDTVKLKVNRAVLRLFLVPGEETTAYIDLSKLSMSASRLHHKTYEKKQKAWFDGAAELINTELASGKRSPALEVYHAVESDLMNSEGLSAKLRDDADRVKPLCEKILAKKELQSADNKLLDAVTFPEISAYVRLRNQALKSEIMRMGSEKETLVGELDRQLSGETLLPSLLAPYRGKAVLIDFWATWCAPCRKSFKVMRPLRKKLASAPVVYLYLTGPSSPELVWRTMLEEIPGIHYRLTEEQWKYLCETYHIKGIPAYLVVNPDGNVAYTHVGFPGIDILQDELLRVVNP